MSLAVPDGAHPLAAVRVFNGTGASLPAGVLTLYDANGCAPYAGDARLGGVPTGETRTLAYAQDLWRFAVDLQPGETQTLSYALDSDEEQATAMLDDADELAAVSGLPGLPVAARAALDRIAALRATEAARTAERDRLNAQREAVEADEGRLRDNLQAVQPGDALRTRLVRQLDADETRHGQIAAAIEAADAAVDKAHGALVDAIGALKL